MNKRKKTRWTSALLGLFLAASMVLGFGPKAMAVDTAPSPSVTVHDLQGLLSAIETTDAGGIIGVDAEIMVTPGTALGTFTKGVTIQRMTAEGQINIHSDDGTGDPVTVNNIIFDGAKVSSNMAFVVMNCAANFEGVAFSNCDSQTCGAVEVRIGEAHFKNCTFKDNRASLGGHVSINDGSGYFESCTLSNGYAENGGAIRIGSSGATCQIESSTITQNEASGIGGGIWNAGTLTITGSKVFSNTTGDIANRGGNVTLTDSIEALTALFAQDNLIPSGWTEETLKDEFNMSYTRYTMAFTTPDPTPTPIPDSGNDDDTPTQPSHSGSSGGSTTIKVNTPKPVLACGGAVLDATQTAYLLGYADGLFGQDNAVTRAQAAQILYRVLTTDSRAKIQVKHGAFTDVPTGAWYAESVDAMTSAGIISGCGDGRFNPDEKITWGELATIMARFVDHKPVSHIITTHWAKDALNTAIDFGWIDYTDQFKPDAPVNRGEMINFISAVFTWAGTQSTTK